MLLKQIFIFFNYFPGKYYIEQAQLIIDVLGSPSEKFLSACKSDIIKTFIKRKLNLCVYIFAVTTKSFSFMLQVKKFSQKLIVRIFYLNPNKIKISDR